MSKWLVKNRGKTTFDLHRARIPESARMGRMAQVWNHKIEGMPPNIIAEAAINFYFDLLKRLPDVIFYVTPTGALGVDLTMYDPQEAATVCNDWWTKLENGVSKAKHESKDEWRNEYSYTNRAHTVRPGDRSGWERGQWSTDPSTPNEWQNALRGPEQETEVVNWGDCELIRDGRGDYHVAEGSPEGTEWATSAIEARLGNHIYGKSVNDKIRALPMTRAGIAPAAVAAAEAEFETRHRRVVFVGQPQKWFKDNNGQFPIKDRKQAKRAGLGFVRQEIVVVMQPNGCTKAFRKAGFWSLFRCTACGRHHYLGYGDNVIRGTDMPDGEDMPIGRVDGALFAELDAEFFWDIGDTPPLPGEQEVQEGLESWWTGKTHYNENKNCRQQRGLYSHLMEACGWVYGNSMRHHAKS